MRFIHVQSLAELFQIFTVIQYKYWNFVINHVAYLHLIYIYALMQAAKH